MTPPRSPPPGRRDIGRSHDRACEPAVTGAGPGSAATDPGALRGVPQRIAPVGLLGFADVSALGGLAQSFGWLGRTQCL